MESSSAVPTVVRFGIFEADLASGELRKRGRKVALQDQPFQVLALLLRHAGEIVTREELQHALWPAETFVEFEQGLNTAVKRLRLALGDSADNPRFIETLPRKGYRFIAPVEVVRPAVALETADPAAPAAPAMAPPSARKRRRWVWIAGLAALVALILITGLWPPPQPVVRATQLTSDARNKWAVLVVSGGRILYSAWGLGKEAAKEELWSVPWTGGEARREPTPCDREGFRSEIEDVNYARQRLWLACSPAANETDLWMTGLDLSSPKSMGHYNLPFWTVGLLPDLETVLISRDKGLFLKPVDGGEERLLARVEGFEMGSPFCHPSGVRIGIQRRMSGRSQLWEIRTDGTGLRPLVPEFTADQCCGEWSPDGRRLYFISQGDIYLQGGREWLGWMRRRVPIRLTSGPMHLALPNEDPANPLVIYAVGGEEQATAMKLDRKTNAWEPFLDGLAADCVSYSPDGQWIAYVKLSGYELWKCRRDGSGKVLLVDGLTTYWPQWSPDGNRIAFQGGPRNVAGVPPPAHIYMISATGGRPEPVPGVPGPASDASWSPDGKRLVYAPFRGDVPKEQQHVSIVNLETGAVEAVPGSDGLWAARWSPDGKWLVAHSFDKAWTYVYSFATRKWTVLQPSSTGFSHWSRDSRSVYFTEWLPELRLARIAVATGKLEEVHKLREFAFADGAFWTPEEEPIVLKRVSSSQIYRIERDR